MLGAPGAGKTALLRMVEAELKQQGRAVFFVNFRGLSYPGELGTRVVDAIAVWLFREADDRLVIRPARGAGTQHRCFQPARLGSLSQAGVALHDPLCSWRMWTEQHLAIEPLMSLVEREG